MRAWREIIMVMNSRVDYNRFEMDGRNPADEPAERPRPVVGTLEVRGGAVEGGGVCVLQGLEGRQRSML